MKMAKERHAELCEILRYHNMLYYQRDEPEISDGEYDRLLSELEVIEKDHPGFITNDSPTQTVGYPIQEGFKEVTHSVPMLSLQKVHSVEELLSWGGKIERELARKRRQS